MVTEITSTPLVSVIIRSMDRPTLSDALRSIASQTYLNIEVILVNAKGRDHRERDERCGQFPMRMVGNGEPLPRSRAANVGLEAANGDYLIFLDDDDWFEPHHIAKLKEVLEHSENIIAAYSAIRCINETGEEIKRFEEAFDPIQFRINNFIPIHAVLFRRLAIDKGARFDETLSVCEDWDFWLQILVYGGFQFIPEIGATYRMQSGMGSDVWDDSVGTRRTMLIIYRKWMPKWSDSILWSVLEYTRYRRMFIDNNRNLCEHVAQLDTHIAERNKQILEQNNKIAKQDKQILEQSNKIAKQGESITKYDARINEFLLSTSWRITKPLREIKYFLKKL